jgi:hypothetical protein
LSHNSFINDTVESITRSLTRNTTLCELNLRDNQIISRYDGTIKENPNKLITGEASQIYKMIVVAATNQSLKIFRVKNIYLKIKSKESSCSFSLVRRKSYRYTLCNDYVRSIIQT